MKKSWFILFILFITIHSLFGQWNKLTCVSVSYWNSTYGYYADGNFVDMCFCSKDTGIYTYGWSISHNSYSGSKRTVDGTASWIQTNFEDYPSSCYTVRGKKIFYQTGLFNINRSFDGGVTWPGFGPLTPTYYSSVFPIDSFLYSINGYTLNKSDGTYWPVEVQDFSPYRPKKCYFINVDTGFTILSQPLHSNSMIMRTTDGGLNWETVFNDTTKFVSSVVFPSKNTGYFGGQQGLLLKTSDNGMTFQQIPLPNTMSIRLIDFFNDSVGVLEGDSGKVLITKNSGQTWVLEKIGSASSNTIVSKIYCFRDSIVYALIGQCIYVRNINQVNDNSSSDVIFTENEFSIFPNPANDAIYLKLSDEMQSDRKMNARVFDSTGKQIYNSEVTLGNEAEKIDFKANAKGIYILVLSDGENTYTKKVLFE